MQVFQHLGQRLLHIHWNPSLGLQNGFRNRGEAVVDLGVRDEVPPSGILLQSPGIPDDDQEVPWSGDGYVQPSYVGKETKAALDLGRVVAPNAVEDDDIFFTALEGIYCVHLNGFLLI